MGPYRVIVANPSGAVTSGPAMLSLAWPPAITLQPADQTVLGNGTAVFTVGATGTPPLRYQWQWHGTNLPGQTASTLTLASVQPWQLGPYRAMVANDFGSATSSNAVLTVNVPCTIFTHPTNLSIVPSPATSTNTTTNAVFTVVAGGLGPLSYQWTFWGTNLPGLTNATLVISNVSLGDAGPYAVRVSDTFTEVTSSNARLALLVKPTITVPIQPQSVVYGGSVTFSVWAGPLHPTLPLTNRWLRNGLYFLTNAQPTLLLSNLTNAATYQVVVLNPAGADYRAPVVLTVLADADQDGLPNVWMTNYFGHTNGLAGDLSRPLDDADGDGAANLQEYQAGTDPTDARSVFKVMFPPDPMSGGTLWFYFTAVSNKTYSAEYRDHLGGTGWSNLTSWDSLPTNRVIRFTNEVAPPSSELYYRAKTPRNF